MQFPVAFVALAASCLSFASAAPVADASNHQTVDINIRIKDCSQRGGDWYWNSGSKSCDRRENYKHKNNHDYDHDRHDKHDYDHDNKHMDHKNHKGNHYIRDAAPEASNHEVDIIVIIQQCTKRGGDWYWNSNSKSCEHRRHHDNDYDHDRHDKHDYDHDRHDKHDYDHDNKHMDHKNHKDHKGNHYIRDAAPEASNHEVDIVIIIRECNKRGGDWYWNSNSKSCEHRRHHDNDYDHDRHNKHDYDHDNKHMDHKDHKDHKGNHYIRDAAPEASNHEVDIIIIIRECNKRGGDWYWNSNSKSCEHRRHHDNDYDHDRHNKHDYDHDNKNKHDNDYKYKHNNDYKNKHYIRDVEEVSETAESFSA